MTASPLVATQESMPDGLDPYQELVWQLHRLPGGAAAALADFFGNLLAETPTPDRWRFKEGGQLELQADGDLRHGGTHITHLPPALRAAAAAAAISPVLLGLLALATGQIDGDRHLKAVLPKVDAAAKDLMLMTVCRLCG
jgi:GAF domain-containing protein